MKRVLVVVGTRPEAVKLAPVVKALRARRGLRVTLCSTGQHRELLARALADFGLRPDLDLRLMRPAQRPGELCARVILGMDAALARLGPDLLVVQGDTTTALGAALAAYRRGVPVAHVEAGLRSHDFANPYPEEFNRVLIDRLASLRLAPTPRAARNLRREGLGGPGLLVTGNTVVDALRWSAPRAGASPVRKKKGEVLLAVTLHRRESFGRPLAAVCRAVAAAARRVPGLRVVFPVHPNPRVREAVRVLAGRERISLIAPLSYRPFLALLREADLVLTDSGGVQEECAALGRPVLVARGVTERPEVLACGAGRLVGTDEARVTREVTALASDPARRRAMARARNPFGDGRAGERSAAAVVHALGLGPRPRGWRG